MEVNNQAKLEPELNSAPMDLPKDTNNIIDVIKDKVNKHKVKHIISHSEIFDEILEKAESIDYEDIVFPQLKKLRERLKSVEAGSSESKLINSEIRKCKLLPKHYSVVTIEELDNLVKKHNFGLSKRNGSIYIYNGAFWQKVNEDEFKYFLKQISLKFGLEKYNAKYHRTIDDLFKQFLSSSYLKLPQQNIYKVLINLANGTLEINKGKIKLREFRKNDFLTYQLNFNYNPEAKAPIFQRYLDRVLPQKELQFNLSEYVGSAFIKNGNEDLKFEKTLILYGSGANGKSVFFEIVNKLFGKENITSFSLQKLTDDTGYSRVHIEGKLINYASVISTKIDTNTFKQLSSGEPVEARSPHKEPFIMTDYAKIICNCNELPKDVEQNEAFFRRFLIIPFKITIPKEERNKNLHNEIIDNELDGVLNWVLEGLNRIITTRHFTKSNIVEEMLNQYKLESDSVAMFIDEGYTKSTKGKYLISDLYKNYREYCTSSGFVALNQKNFKRRLEAQSIEIRRTSGGNYVYVESTMINDF
ncbi:MULTISPECIES: DNA primase family protein [unclassified Empedobacter]|uniref:DNA primase family protein n=1 Tax=unclassified Empedobacter TaxID=2643773 RepID=UPI0025B99C1A|nr:MULTISPECIES: DNA primase family protein [unclassified Empedobacter]